MADRYVTRAAFQHDDGSGWGPSMTADTVADHADEAPHKTGLLDAAGTPLYRVPERVPLGFAMGRR